MRRFFLAYPIQQTSAELEWSKYVALLAMKDEKKRSQIEKRAITE